MRNLLKIIPLALVITWMAGCKPGVPRELIQPGEMEKILYDYHLADGMAMADGSYEDLSLRRTVYREAALRKHGVTQAEFDSSLVYYYRNTELLHQIYERLAKRLNDESVNLGSTANEMSQLGGAVGQGDTTTVWTYPHAVALMPIAPYNIISYSVKADTSYHAGDKMIFSVDAQFIFQDGIRDGVAMLAVTFQNDSTATQVMHMSSNKQYMLQVADPNFIGVKIVRGFVYLSGVPDIQSQTIKVMCLKNMRLLKMKWKEEKKENEAGGVPSVGFTPSPEASPPAGANTVSDTAAPVRGERVIMRPAGDERAETAPRAPSARKFP